MIAGWGEPKPGVATEYDLETTPLEIKTNSTLDSKKMIFLTFHTKTGVIAGGFQLKFSSTPQYLLYYCSGWINLPIHPPDITTKFLLVLDRNPGLQLRVFCNDVKLLDMNVHARCRNSQAWRRIIAKIKFNRGDTATELYGPCLSYLNTACLPSLLKLRGKLVISNLVVLIRGSQLV